ncbi:CBS domain-containing protein [Nitrosophilus alvini]|uniref:CBS domain-containing protein n=1 Tax=Nitrosophilus alvini TaxID=2714855 RepID=UPI001909463E|nr:CBS domain-containing protein [Nitrosophilus alvini]
MKAGELCNREVAIVYQHENIKEAAKLMRHFHVGSLVVVMDTEGGRIPVGIITDRDITVEVVARGFNPDNIKVENVMSKELVTGSENEDVYEIIKKMKDHGIRRMPIIDTVGFLVGILTVDDVLEFLSEEMNILVKLFYREIEKESETKE